MPLLGFEAFHQVRRSLRDRSPAGIQRSGHREEAVRHAGITAEVDRHSVVGEPAGVRLALVTQRVVFGGDDERRRQSGETLARSGEASGLAASPGSGR